MNLFFHIIGVVGFLLVAAIDPESNFYCLETRHGVCQKAWIWTPYGDLELPPRQRLAQMHGCE